MARFFEAFPNDRRAVIARRIFDGTMESARTSCIWDVSHLRFERETPARYAVRTHGIDGSPVRNPTREPG